MTHLKVLERFFCRTWCRKCWWARLCHAL